MLGDPIDGPGRFLGRRGEQVNSPLIYVLEMDSMGRSMGKRWEKWGEAMDVGNIRVI